MNSKFIISLWMMLFVLGGKGLAQTSSSTSVSNPAPFYAIVEVGSGLSLNTRCQYPEFVNTLGLGVRLGKNLGFGINHHLTTGVSRWGYHSLHLRGISFQSFYQWHGWRLTAQVGNAKRYEDGCHREIEGFYFRSNEESIRPFYRLTGSYHPSPFLYFWLAWLQSPQIEGTFNYFDSSVSGQGPASFRTKSIQFGIGWYFGR